jgi:hypothetical protein
VQSEETVQMRDCSDAEFVLSGTITSAYIVVLFTRFVDS